eukprot:scpid73050/ scgid6251/ Probable RNA-directed DNA polymerase from transposon X-element; Reverse transcriptase
MSLSSGTVPACFNLPYVSPLFRSGDTAVVGNYRPVSLLPIVSRLLEHCVKKQIMAHLQDHHLLPASRFAYRKSHSTEGALVLAVNRWLLARSKRQHTGVIMVDMSKVFDRVQHQRLITVLHQRLITVLHQRLITVLHQHGIGGTVLSWFTRYLSNRRQQIKVADILSAPVDCSRGVPQGSVLGPLLFVLYTSELSAILPMQVSHQEFADDIVLDFSDSDKHLVCNVFSSAVSKLADWLCSIGLVLNSAKTQVLFIQPRGRPSAMPGIYCNDIRLSVTTTAKYLGVLVDDQLSWQPHVEQVVRKVSVAVGQLWRHGRALSITARRLWYIAIIQSRITYASNSFFPCLTK